MRSGMLLRPVIFSLLSGIAIPAFAQDAGAYLGLMLGGATNGANNEQVQIQNSTATTSASPKHSQFGAAAFFGYQFNSYVALELGANYFSPINYDTNNVSTCTNTQIKVSTIDLVVKGIIPFNETFNVYGKGGVAGVFQSTSGDFYPQSTASTCGDTKNSTSARPTVSLGASYAIDSNWVADASWNYTTAGSKVNYISFYALGISYHFVDRYCGQFLC